MKGLFKPGKFLGCYKFGDGRIVEFYANSDGTGMVYLELSAHGIPLSVGFAPLSEAMKGDVEIFREKVIAALEPKAESRQTAERQLLPVLADY